MEEIKNKQSKKQLLGEIFRFLLIGGFATIVDYVVFYLSTYLLFKGLDKETNKLISTFLGFIAGLIINWIFSARFVYRYEKKTTNKQLLIYIAICVAGLLITELGIFLAMPLYETYYVTIIVKFDFWQLFFKCLMTVIVLILNYLGRKFLIFKK
jgi:putative flippase GtrA